MENSPSGGITDWYYIIRLFLVACSVFLGITMMNIFIGVLGESYSSAYSERECIFWRNRARIVVAERAREMVEAKCRCFFCCKRRGASQKVRPGGVDSLGDTFGVGVAHAAKNTMTNDDVWDYVWFCAPKGEAKDAADGKLEESDDIKDAPSKELEEVRRQLSELKSAVLEMSSTLRAGVQAAHHVQQSSPQFVVASSSVAVRPKSAPPLSKGLYATWHTTGQLVRDGATGLELMRCPSPAVVDTQERGRAQGRDSASPPIASPQEWWQTPLSGPQYGEQRMHEDLYSESIRGQAHATTLPVLT